MGRQTLFSNFCKLRTMLGVGINARGSSRLKDVSWSGYFSIPGAILNLEESMYQCFDFWGHMAVCQEALGKVAYHHTACPVVQPDILAGNVNICPQML